MNILDFKHMKNTKIIFIPLFFILIGFNSFCQRKSELKSEIFFLKIEVEKLKTLNQTLNLEIEKNKNFNLQEIEKLKQELSQIQYLLKNSNNTSNLVYPPINQELGKNSSKGTQTNSINANKPENEKNSKYGYTPSTGATIHTGPRGGRYYYNSKGNKVYVKRN
ncbi:MAG: hypothetical protein IPP61_12865 [Cytophagaceae bacterium]|nr:hypothetical protein [Cytophagaceae bacterium]